MYNTYYTIIIVTKQTSRGNEINVVKFVPSKKQMKTSPRKLTKLANKIKIIMKKKIWAVKVKSSCI